MPDSPIQFLIVDQKQEIRELCASVGQRLGLRCVQVDTAEAALQAVEIDPPEMVLADLTGKMSGLELLSEIKRCWPRSVVALMSADGNVEIAVDAMRLGAHDFILKPLQLKKVSLVLKDMAEKVFSLRRERVAGDGQTDKMGLVSPLPVPCTDLEELERLTVRRVFEFVDGDKAKAQKLLGISRATLYRKIKRYGIETRQNRQEVPVKAVRGERERVILLSQS